MNLQMLRVSHYVLKCFDEVYREFGLRATQMPVLHHLARTAGAASVRDIATALESERSVMFRKLRVLCDNGWIDECRPDDRRERCYTLTAEGHALLERIEPAREAVQARLLGRLSDDEQHLLLTLCARLREEAAPFNDDTGEQRR